MKNVKISLSRTQDAEVERLQYDGHLRSVNGRTVVTFDDEDTSHLLKLSEDGMDWTRVLRFKEKRMSSGTSFLRGELTPFDLVTPGGVIKMEIRTRVYEYKVTDLHEVHLSYTIEQYGNIVSDYEVSLIITES